MRDAYFPSSVAGSSENVDATDIAFVRVSRLLSEMADAYELWLRAEGVVERGRVNLGRLARVCGTKTVVDDEAEPWTVRTVDGVNEIVVGNAERAMASTKPYLKEATLSMVRARLSAFATMPDLAAESIATVLTYRLLGMDENVAMLSGRIELGEPACDIDTEGALPAWWAA